MSDRFPFDEELFPVPPSAMDADPAAAMQSLLYRVSKMEQTLDEERQQAIADTRELLLQMVALSDDVTRIVERWGVTANAKEAAIMQGVVAFGKKILAILDHYGVKPIDTLAKPQNPRTSDVVGAEVRERLKPDMVLREAQIGYTWRHGLLRKARVVVSRGGPPDQEATQQGPDNDPPIPDTSSAGASEDNTKGGIVQ
jgi:molecular chaperone GrpE (heat shock protein)